MDDKLKKIISDYVSDYMGKSSWNCVVKKSIPVIWFGNIERYKESELKIVTVGINPSLKEFPDLPEKPRFNIPDSLSGNEENLYNILNDYFNNNPYKLWFEQYEKILEGSTDGKEMYLLGRMRYKIDNKAWATRETGTMRYDSNGNFVDIT